MWCNYINKYILYYNQYHINNDHNSVALLKNGNSISKIENNLKKED